LTLLWPRSSSRSTTRCETSSESIPPSTSTSSRSMPIPSVDLPFPLRLLLKARLTRSVLFHPVRRPGLAESNDCLHHRRLGHHRNLRRDQASERDGLAHDHDPGMLSPHLSFCLSGSQLIDLLRPLRLLLRPQVYEYFISHHLAKAFESLFGSVTCLPGCFSVYRLRTADKGRPIIISQRIIDDYSENLVDTLHKKNLFSLGEDRYLTTLMMKYFPAYKMKFTPDAIAWTVAPDRWAVLLSQRRRWINSTIHNLAELYFLPELCGFCLFSMRFIVFLDLVGTLVSRTSPSPLASHPAEADAFPLSLLVADPPGYLRLPLLPYHHRCHRLGSRSHHRFGHDRSSLRSSGSPSPFALSFKQIEISSLSSFSLGYHLPHQARVHAHRMDGHLHLGVSPLVLQSPLLWPPC
jgi:hypothetical protein